MSSRFWATNMVRFRRPWAIPSSIEDVWIPTSEVRPNQIRVGDPLDNVAQDRSLVQQRVRPPHPVSRALEKRREQAIVDLVEQDSEWHDHERQGGRGGHARDAAPAG